MPSAAFFSYPLRENAVRYGFLPISRRKSAFAHHLFPSATVFWRSLPEIGVRCGNFPISHGKTPSAAGNPRFLVADGEI
jgi:hypothetical protein